MARKPDPSRKPVLTQQALDVITFTLEYRFGSRAEPVRELIRANALTHSSAKLRANRTIAVGARE